MKRENLQFILLLLLLMGGIYSLSAQVNEWFHFTPNDRIEHIAQTDDYLWVHTVDGIVKFNTKTNEKTFFDKTHPATLSEEIHGLARLGDGGVIIVVTYDLGVLRIADEGWTYFDTTNSVIPTYDVIAVSSVSDYSSVWMATQSSPSLIRFDDLNWELHPIPGGEDEEMTQTILVDQADRIWVGTNRRLVRYDGTNWEDFTAGIYEAGASDLVVNYLYEDDQGGIWTGISGSLFRYADEQWQQLADNLGRLRISEDGDGNIWISSQKLDETAKVFQYVNQSLRPITPESSEIPVETYASLFRDDAGNLWMGGFPGNLTRYKDGVFEEYDLSNSEMKLRNTNDITIDDANGIWVLGDDKLLIHKNQSWTNMPLPAYLGDRLLVNNEQIWILNTAPLQAQLSIYQAGEWRYLTTDNFFEPDSRLIDMRLDAQSGLWVLGERAIYHWKDEQWHTYTSQNSALPASLFSAMTIDQSGQVWFTDAQSSQLYRFDGERLRAFAHPEPLGTPSSQVLLEADEAGKIWIYSEAGLYYFHGQEFFPTNIDFPIQSISTDGGNLILSSGSTVRIQRGLETIQALTAYNSSLRKGRPGKIITDAFGNYWISNLDRKHGGLSIYNPAGISNSITSIDHTSVDEGNISFRNFPNPFSAQTVIQYHLAQPEKVKLEIFDITGRKIETLTNERQMAGIHSYQWHSEQFPEGLYMARLSLGTKIFNRKILFIR